MQNWQENSLNLTHSLIKINNNEEKEGPYI